MNINEKLLPEWDYYEYYYDCDHELIKNFLLHEHKFLNRRTLAITAIEKIMTAHNKQDLLKHVSHLAHIEHGMKKIVPRMRDHVVHAMLSYLLGVYINENYIKNILGNRVDTFQWKLAGLFHDIGYPTQIAKELLRTYTDNINSIKNKIGVESQDVYFNIVPRGLDTLQHNINSFDLIQNTLNNWDLDINCRCVYDNYINNGLICHGMISSLCVLYIIDLLYQKNNPTREILSYSGWSQEYFDNDVVPACTAIFIHNLPSSYFVNTKISLVKSPIAFLLKLSDCLQDWERPSFHNRKGFSANTYDIKINDNKIFFKAPARRRSNIIGEVFGSLSSEDIVFV